MLVGLSWAWKYLHQGINQLFLWVHCNSHVLWWQIPFDYERGVVVVNLEDHFGRCVKWRVFDIVRSKYPHLVNWSYPYFAGVSAASGVAVFRCFQGANMCSEAWRERNRGCSCWSRHRLWWAFQQHRGGNVPELDCAIRKKRKLLPPYIDSAVFPSPKAEAGKFRRRKLLRELRIRYSGSQRGASVLILQRS